MPPHKKPQTFSIYLIGVSKLMLLLMFNFNCMSTVPSLLPEMSFSQSFDNLSVGPEGYISEKGDFVGKYYLLTGTCMQIITAFWKYLIVVWRVNTTITPRSDNVCVNSVNKAFKLFNARGGPALNFHFHPCYFCCFFHTSCSFLPQILTCLTFLACLGVVLCGIGNTYGLC